MSDRRAEANRESESRFKQLITDYITANQDQLLAGEPAGHIRISRNAGFGWSVVVSVSADQKASVSLLIKEEDLLGWMWLAKR